MVLSTRTGGRTHSGHQPWEAGTCLSSVACAKLAVIVAGATAAAEPIATAPASTGKGRRWGTGAPIGDSDMGTTGVEDGQAGASLDVMGNGMFWMLERGAACPAPLRSTVELEVAGSNAEGWGE